MSACFSFKYKIHRLNTQIVNNICIIVVDIRQCKIEDPFWLGSFATKVQLICCVDFIQYYIDM